jgi:hypothetical protein
MEIEGGADADERCCADALGVCRHPLLLLSCTEAHPHDIRLGFIYHAYHFSLRFGNKGMERGRIMACNGHLRKPPLKPVGQFRSHTRCTPVEEVPEPE